MKATKGLSHVLIALSIFAFAKMSLVDQILGP